MPVTLWSRKGRPRSVSEIGWRDWTVRPARNAERCLRSDPWAPRFTGTEVFSLSSPCDWLSRSTYCVLF